MPLKLYIYEKLVIISFILQNFFLHSETPNIGGNLVAKLDLWVTFPGNHLKFVLFPKFQIALCFIEYSGFFFTLDNQNMFSLYVKL